MANETAITLPFTIDPYGKVGSTTDQTKIWADRVLSVIGTMLRERVMRPSFGTVIPYAMFNDVTSAKSEIDSEINSAFTLQLPLLKLISVDTTVDEYTNILSVMITYELPNQTVVETNVGVISLSGTNPAYQELL